MFLKSVLIFPSLERSIIGIAPELQKKHIGNPSQSINYNGWLNREQFAHFHIKFKATNFAVSKFILMSRSPVFHRMLTSPMAERNSNHMELQDWIGEEFHSYHLYITLMMMSS